MRFDCVRVRFTPKFLRPKRSPNGRFSRRSIENPFEGVDYELSRTGLPILKGVSAWFECHNRSRYPEGDHVIFVGEVEHCEVHPREPLVFHGGKLGGLHVPG